MLQKDIKKLLQSKNTAYVYQNIINNKTNIKNCNKNRFKNKILKNIISKKHFKIMKYLQTLQNMKKIYKKQNKIAQYKKLY